MKPTKTALHLVFALLAATFLSACSSWQDGSDSGYNDSGYSNSGGGHSGHGSHH